MKKLLVATSALIAAGSAAALDVSIGGQVTSVVDYDGATNAWGGPTLGGGSDDGLTLTASGSSNGWDYSVSHNLFAADLAGTTMNMSNATWGAFEMSTNSVKWTGLDVAGFAASVSFAPSALETMTFGVSGSLGGASVSGTIANDVARSFNLDLATAMGGADLDINLQGGLGDTSAAALDYTVGLGFSAMGADLGVSLNEAGTIGLTAGLGAISLSTSLTGGDVFANVGVTYSADLADGLSVSAALSQNGTNTDLDITTVMSF